ncbi:polyketide synthase, partial [bacterium]|nr:polyketide synthase [bacterium]
MDNLDEYGGYAIAVVGMALRVPGANTPDQYWHNLKNGVESVEFYDDETLLAKGVTPEQLKNPHYVKAGAPLDGVDQFDPDFFGFSPKEAGILDPQHRHFYECAWEALENAGHVPSTFDGAIGVFAGCGMGAYFAFNLLSNPDLRESVGLFLLRHTGNDKDFLSTRVSYSFNLKGPSINVQTACSTSSVATHLACQSLLNEECDMALAGGVTIEIPHGHGYLYKEGEILSPDGHCRPFDHRSKGTIFGSGAGVIVLRRLEDAIADGDHIYAVICGSAVNNDGSGKVGYLAPSVEGQAEAIAEALAIADLDADSIGYVECHGTGTQMGDPL